MTPGGRAWTGTGSRPTAQPAFALFDNTGVPIHISYTYKFRGLLKRLHEHGTDWAAWKAWPATNRKDAVTLRRQIAERYHWNNVAESDSETVPEFPTGPNPLTRKSATL
ncbi:hypothetical protein [Nocardia sp. NPDC059239]|uniref:hypothetical protein n=1 Tax=Nocardia sp. NPDC059239 TaxID=3346785 RepID=UPI003675DDDD